MQAWSWAAFAFLGNYKIVPVTCRRTHQTLSLHPLRDGLQGGRREEDGKEGDQEESPDVSTSHLKPGQMRCLERALERCQEPWGKTWYTPNPKPLYSPSDTTRWAQDTYRRWSGKQRNPLQVFDTADPSTLLVSTALGQTLTGPTAPPSWTEEQETWRVPSLPGPLCPLLIFPKGFFQTKSAPWKSKMEVFLIFFLTFPRTENSIVSWSLCPRQSQTITSPTSPSVCKQQI